MAEIDFSPTAQSDLDKAAEYIATVLHNPGAAQRLVQNMKSQIATLREFPEMGALIEQDRQSSLYRRLVCGNYLSIYHIENGVVHIDRILNGRRDYLTLLFGKEPERDES